MPQGSLQDLLYKNKSEVSLRRYFELAFGVVSGLRVLHRKGMVHKDIKPDNIFIDRNWQAKIGDYGVMYHRDNRSQASPYVTDVMGPQSH